MLFQEFPKKTVVSCAPITVYLRLNTKNGTPRTPILRALSISACTLSAKVLFSNTSFNPSMFSPISFASCIKVGVSSIFFPSVKYALYYFYNFISNGETIVVFFVGSLETVIAIIRILLLSGSTNVLAPCCISMAYLYR